MSSIDVRSLTKHFGDVVAVEDLSFTVESGEVVGLLGANGAGKTTTMKMILGLLTPTSGEVAITGEPASRVDRRSMGYVPQGLGLWGDLTVVENLSFACAAFGVDVPTLDGTGLEPVSGRRVAEISLGLRRRLAFVIARCHQPQVLILDEPTSGVGPLGRARLWETIHETAESGTAILVSTHYMDEAEECDRVVLMARGREIASGPVTDVIAGARSVAISGELTDEEVSALRDAGGHALMDGPDWRVVGVDEQTIRSILSRSVELEDVPSTFEEAFVALSR